MRALEALGVRTVPVVSRGSAWISGLVLNEIAAFVGLEEDPTVALPPAQLVTRLDVMLAAACRYLPQFDEAALGAPVRDRNRTLRDLGYHVFLIPREFLDAARGGHLDYDRLVEKPPSEIRTGPELAAFGETMRAEVSAWWDTQPQGLADQPLSTYYGPQSAHALLERTTWHCAQHVRQLMMMLADAGLEPNGRLGAEEFAGLPLPNGVWD